MVAAIVGTLLHGEIVDFRWILIAAFIGSAIGAALAIFMPMTAMPQRIAISHAFGALAAALVGTAEFLLGRGDLDTLHRRRAGPRDAARLPDRARAR